MVTVALATPAPLGSLTLPRMVPEADWASNEGMLEANKATSGNTCLIFLTPIKLLDPILRLFSSAVKISYVGQASACGRFQSASRSFRFIASRPIEIGRRLKPAL